MKRNELFLVTVTYGSRRGLLQNMLAAAKAEGIVNVVVVDNGANWNLAELVPMFAEIDLHIVPMGCNTGSACGFSAGISAAIGRGAETIWLLDDDNRPLPGTLATLLSGAEEHLVGDAKSRNALLAFRPEHQPEVARRPRKRRFGPRPSSFHCFHVLDMPSKIWGRLFGKLRQHAAAEPPVEQVELSTAPYSGLLFNRSLITKIGLPRTDFVLYSDDTEFTYRITRTGGKIVLLTGALLEDMESSWHVQHGHGTAIHSLLLGQGDFRVYYGFRNAIYFQRFYLKENRLVVNLNKHLFMFCLQVFSLVWRRRDRYRLIKMAVADGSSGRLGQHSRFTL